MEFSRRTILKGAAGALVGGAPVILTTRKAQAQTSFLSSSLIQQINSCALGLYQATPDTVADPLDRLGLTLNNFAQEMYANGLYQLGVNTVPGQVGSSGVIPFDSSAMSYFNDAQNALGYGLPEDMFNLYPDAQPTIDQVQATHADVHTYGIIVNNLQRAFFWESSKLSGAQYGLNNRTSHLIYASTRHQPGENRYRLRRVSSGSLTPTEKAGIGLGTAGVFVGGGGALIAASGVTAATVTTASAVAVGIFTLGLGFVVLGLGIGAYYGITYLSDAASVENSGGSISLPTVSSIPRNRMCLPAPF